MVCAKLNLTYPKGHASSIRPTCYCHAIWLHLVPEPSILFSVSCDCVTSVTISCDL